MGIRIIGLTGGTGSGKSEVARHMAASGVAVIDADKIGHDILLPGGPAYGPVLEAFGNEILTDGRIDRAKLGAIVFPDPAALARLSTITHPIIGCEIGAWCASFAEAGRRVAIVDAAILGEDGQKERWLDRLILVTAPADLRARRLQEGRGLTSEEAWRRINAQTPPEQKIPLADWVIENTGSLEALRRRTDEILEEIHGNPG